MIWLSRCFIADRFDSHVQGREVDIKQIWIRSVILLQFEHVPGEKPECGFCSDIVWVLVTEVHELVVEERSQLIGQVLHVVEILDDLQACLEGFNLRS